MILMWYLLIANTTFAFTHADTLRGSNGRGRDWWDVKKYDLSVVFDTASKSIIGRNNISFSIIKKPTDSLQIDLQEPMIIDSVYLVEQIYLRGYVEAETDTIIYTKLDYKKEGNVWWLFYRFHKWDITENGDNHERLKKIIVCYHGKPRKAINPPWDGGFSWRHDKNGKPWVAVSCQGLGASIWWPCKDAQWDEPDDGMKMSFTAPKELTAISNGRLIRSDTGNETRTMQWEVNNPINNYDATFYIGDYVHWHDTLMGEEGLLDLDFWVLRDNEEKARKQFAVVKPMIHCFEYWMGPYPFYEDGYKLVDAPYLGMEHQSAVAYGNNYQMGYRGFDRTFTGVGMNFDYIIIHESGHEWFGNSVTAADMADNWIHEGITTYSEALFTECLLGKEKANQYSKGERLNITNDTTIIGQYGVNKEGSNDMYDKGATIMYMIRLMTGDDEKFRQMLRGLSQQYYHSIVTTAKVENYIATHTGLDLKAFFNQYLRTKDIPQIEYYIKDDRLYFKFNKAVDGLTLPIAVSCEGTTETIHPTSSWQNIKWKAGYNVKFSNDFLFTVKK